MAKLIGSLIALLLLGNFAAAAVPCAACAAARPVVQVATASKPATAPVACGQANGSCVSKIVHVRHWRIFNRRCR